MKREERMTYFIMTNWTWNQAQAFIQVLNHWPMKILGCVALKTKSIHGTFERGLSTENNHTFFVAEGFQTRWSRSEWSSLLTVTMWRETKVKSVQIFKSSKTWLLWHGYDPIHHHFCAIRFSRTRFQIVFYGVSKSTWFVMDLLQSRNIIRPR